MFKYKKKFPLLSASVSPSHVAFARHRRRRLQSLRARLHGEVVGRICCLRGVTDKGLIDGVVNKCQGSLPASAAAVVATARGPEDKEIEEGGLGLWKHFFSLYIYNQKSVDNQRVKENVKPFVGEARQRENLYRGFMSLRSPKQRILRNSSECHDENDKLN